MGWANATAAGLQLWGDSQSAKGQIEAQKAQARQLITNYNYTIQQTGFERVDALQSALSESTQIRQNALSLESGVRAAVAENYGGGRTGDLLVRAAEGSTQRALSSVQRNLVQRMSEMDYNLNTAYMNTRFGIADINSNMKAIRKSQTVGALGTLLSAYTGAMNERTAAKTSGLRWSWTRGTYGAVNNAQKEAAARGYNVG